MSLQKREALFPVVGIFEYFETAFVFWLFPNKFQLTDVFVHILIGVQSDRQNSDGYTKYRFCYRDQTLHNHESGWKDLCKAVGSASVVGSEVAIAQPEEHWGKLNLKYTKIRKNLHSSWCIEIYKDKLKLVSVSLSYNLIDAGNLLW